MAVTALEIDVPVHTALVTALTGFQVPSGCHALHVYAAADVTFEIATADNDGDTVHADAYFTWTVERSDESPILKLSAYHRDLARKGTLFIGFAGNTVDLEICALGDGGY